MKENMKTNSRQNAMVNNKIKDSFSQQSERDSFWNGHNTSTAKNDLQAIFMASNNGSEGSPSPILQSLLWQVPFAERKSILDQQAKAIQDDEDDCFALAEETDLNDEDLDEHANRMMSIRALHINTLHRFSPGFNK